MPGEKQRSPKLELVLSTEFNECSIASAELAQRTEELLANRDLVSRQQLLVMECSGPAVEQLTIVPVSEEFQTPANRSVCFVLGREAFRPKKSAQMPPARLFAVTRGDVAFPLASFSRRDGSQCDYVQIDGEMEDDSFIVTPRDEYSRKDIIETMRVILGKNVLFMRYGEVIRQAKEDSYMHSIELRNEVSKNSTSTVSYNKRLKGDAPALRAIADIIGNTKTDRKLLTMVSGMRYDAAYDELKKFLVKPGFKSILEGELPGSKHELGRKALIAHAANLLGFRETSRGADDAYQRLVKYLEIDKQMAAVLGECEPVAEGVYRLAGALAVRGTMEIVREDARISSTRGDVKIFVDIKPESPAAYSISIKARPAAMPDHSPSQIYAFKLDRTMPAPFNYSDALEIYDILGRVSLASKS